MPTALPKILCVDDDPNLLDGFRRNLRRLFTLDTATSGAEALVLVQTKGPYAVVLADMRMPGMDGVELLEQVRALAPDTVRLMLTGNSDQQTAVEAVNRGHVFRFLNKPCAAEILAPALDLAVKQYELQALEKELLEETLAGAVKALSDVLGLVAPEALGRGQRLRESMQPFAKWQGAGPLWELEIASLLSPIGHTSLPVSIIRKLSANSALEPNEAEIVRRLPRIGHDLIAGIPRLQNAARIVLYQDKHFDGSGYPDEPVSGEEIPLGARMLKILGDRLDLERDGIVKKAALATMRERTGTYDPKLLEACFACFENFLCQSIAPDRPVKSLMVSQLTPRHVVVSDITTHAGLMLVSSGHRLTAMMIARLRNYAELLAVKEPVLVQESGSDFIQIPKH